MYITIDADYTLAVPAEAGNYANSVIVLGVDSSGGAVNITLPAISSLGAQNYTRIIVQDEAGDAAANPITVTPDAADLVNGATTMVLNSGSGALILQISGPTKWAGTSTGSTTPTASVTATVAGATTGVIPSRGNIFVTVASGNAAHLVTLPTPIPGTKVFISTVGAANDCELQSNDPATVAINGGVGAGKHTTLTKDLYYELTCISDTLWMGEEFAADGAITKMAPAA